MLEQSSYRVKITDSARRDLFESLVMGGLDAKEVAARLGVHVRTVRDWRRGKYTIPSEKFLVLLELSGNRPGDNQVSIVSRWWHTSAAGNKGGKAYMAKYGSAGTLESRRAGGESSYVKRKLHDNDIYARKPILRPEFSTELAEFVGIMLGDGHVDRYQITVALNSEVDQEYAGFVKSLIERLFGIRVNVSLRIKAKCVILTASSVELVEYLETIGLIGGNKVTQQVAIPDWIMNDREYSLTCVRGLFDTDGSVFLERHQIHGAQYCYTRMAFVNMSVPLRNGVREILQESGIDARIYAERNVTIGRFTDIEKYFRIIGSSNPKHLRRFAQFGGVG